MTHYVVCYSNLLDLLRVQTRVCSYNLYATPFLRFPSQLTLMKLSKLKRIQSVCTEKREKEREKERKNREKTMVFSFFPKKSCQNKKKSSHLSLSSVPICLRFLRLSEYWRNTTEVEKTRWVPRTETTSVWSSTFISWYRYRFFTSWKQEYGCPLCRTRTVENFGGVFALEKHFLRTFGKGTNVCLSYLLQTFFH
jgi:hypothetical protein